MVRTWTGGVHTLYATRIEPVSVARPAEPAEGNQARQSTEAMSVVPDRGCGLHPSCLACPRERCYHDETQGARLTAQRLERYGAIRRDHAALGLAVGALAHRYRVSERTVSRALQETVPVEPYRA